MQVKSNPDARDGKSGSGPEEGSSASGRDTVCCPRRDHVRGAGRAFAGRAGRPTGSRECGQVVSAWRTVNIFL